MTDYIPMHISLTDAIELLRSRGVQDAEEQLLKALKDGAITAWGLADGVRKELRPAWWHHRNSPLDMNTVWFDRKDTDPPTPFRAERVEVPRNTLDEIWAPVTECPDTSKNSVVPSESLAGNISLHEFIFQQGRQGEKYKEQIREEAKNAGYHFTNEVFNKAFKKVYKTERKRRPLTGWPLTSEFQSRIDNE